MLKTKNNKSKRHRFSLPITEKQQVIQKSRIHKSFSENDFRHPIVKKHVFLQNNKIITIKKSHSSKGFTDKSLETHLKKYKLKKKTFSEMKQVLKDFNTFYPELKRFVSHVKYFF